MRKNKQKQKSELLRMATRKRGKGKRGKKRDWKNEDERKREENECKIKMIKNKG